jgi:excinuclease UvrABC nuclease subunit
MADPQSYRPSNIPEHPGVYRFYNAKDKIIYVGKAKNLKNRLSNYFQANLATKTYRMVHEAVRVDWTIVSTELEALALNLVGSSNINLSTTFNSRMTSPIHTLRYPSTMNTQ